MKLLKGLCLASVVNSQCSTIAVAECSLEGGASGTVKLHRELCDWEEKVKITGTIDCLSRIGILGE